MNGNSESKLHNRGFEYIELTGRKVRLRTTNADDAVPAYKLVHNQQGILKWLYWSGPGKRRELADTYGIRWPEEMRQGINYSLAIEEKDRPGAFIGCIEARLLRYPQQFEVGYWLGVPYWRKGYMPEALALMCYLCFRHLGAVVISSSAFVGNMASRRVQEKNDFQFEGTLRRQVFKDGAWVDLWHLSLLREEWEKRGFQPVSEELVPTYSELNNFPQSI